MNTKVKKDKKINWKGGKDVVTVTYKAHFHIFA